MSDRSVAADFVTRRMIVAFEKGDIVDAQNMEAFVTALEEMTDGDYAKLVTEHVAGAIS